MKVVNVVSTIGLTLGLISTNFKPVNAQGSYGIPYASLSEPQNIDSSFSIHTGEMSCSSGSGSVPSIYVGGMTGSSDLYNQSDMNLNDRQDDDYLSAGIGFNIPLGSKTNKDVNCSELLAIIEGEAFIKMITQMQNLNILDDNKTFTMIARYMRLTGKKLGLDLEAILVLPEEYARRRQKKIEERMIEK
tara:strand:+ start:101 stop:667 length:567 start_codon:yes stop_codon:yes gene_type:complete